MSVFVALCSWMGAWVDGWVGGCVGGWMGGCVGGWMGGGVPGDPTGVDSGKINILSS